SSCISCAPSSFSTFAPASVESSPLSLHDALPILLVAAVLYGLGFGCVQPALQAWAVKDAPANRKGMANATFFSFFDLGIGAAAIDRKSTRLNSSHVSISYAVFCLKNENCVRRS